MTKLRAVQASLAVRFYVADGWTRQAVAELLETENITAVLPSYYDGDKHNEINKLSTFFLMPEELNKEEYADCDYFLVLSEAHKFNITKLKERSDIKYPLQYNEGF